MSDPATGGPPGPSRPAEDERRSDPPALASSIAARFSEVPGVVAVALAGSRASGAADDASDLDLYVYADRDIPLAARRSVAGPDAADGEFDMRFWEPGDSWIDRSSGLHIDVMHRSTAWIEAEIDRVLVRHEASVGYSTAVWHNVRVSLPLDDPSGWFARLQERADGPYPEPLRRAIIAKNHPLLRRSRSSFLRQLEGALRRGDAVAVQHRLTALLASYFDVLFALNRQTHPGEKRLVHHVLEHCRWLPVEFERRLDETLESAASPWAEGRLVEHLRLLLDGIDDLVTGSLHDRGVVQTEEGGTSP